jgi:hypothetical protein
VSKKKPASQLKLTDEEDQNYSKISPFAGYHVDLVDDFVDDKPVLSIYLYFMLNDGVARNSKILCHSVPGDKQSEGEIRRLFMLAEWVCRYLNTGGLIDAADELVDKMFSIAVNAGVGLSPTTHFLGHKLVLPPEGYLPSDRDVDPYSPFVYYVCVGAYDPDRILEVHEFQHSRWVDYVEMDV